VWNTLLLLTVNAIKCVHTLVVMCLSLSIMPHVVVMSVLWSWFLFYIWRWGVCAAIWYLLLAMFQISGYMYRCMCLSCVAYFD
jgi:hypothetical protein